MNRTFIIAFIFLFLLVGAGVLIWAWPRTSFELGGNLESKDGKLKGTFQGEIYFMDPNGNRITYSPLKLHALYTATGDLIASFGGNFKYSVTGSLVNWNTLKVTVEATLKVDYFDGNPQTFTVYTNTFTSQSDSFSFSDDVGNYIDTSRVEDGDQVELTLTITVKVTANDLQGTPLSASDSYTIDIQGIWMSDGSVGDISVTISPASTVMITGNTFGEVLVGILLPIVVIAVAVYFIFVKKEVLS